MAGNRFCRLAFLVHLLNHGRANFIPGFLRLNRGNFLSPAESCSVKALISVKEILMKAKYDRRSFLRVAGTSFGIGALYSVFPGLTRSAGAEGIVRSLAQLNGEAPAPFSFVQLSDSHVGFNGPPDPLGTQAFESAVATINRLKNRPELVIV